MKQFVKQLLYSVAPQWTTALQSSRARAHSQRFMESIGCVPVNQKLIERFGSQVQEGPFAGLVLTPMSHAEQLGPYLLGVYESELDEAWDLVFQGQYSQIIDIGAKFGFYAVALARRYPETTVVAFDTDWWARKAVREMAGANGTKNVDVQGFCTPEWVAQQTQDGAFIISDCEGYESALFGPASIARLKTATLIIETHDFAAPGVTERLRADFGQTHDVRVYGNQPDRRGTTLPLEFLTEKEQRLAAHEVRPPQFWLLCLPKTGPNQALHLSQAAPATAKTS